MRVTFANFGEEIASSRLRAIIPQRELSKLGVKMGSDVLIYGKHVIPIEVTRRFKKRIYDICDDHFNNPEIGGYYIKHANEADLLTCNSEAMRQRIIEEIGRDAIVIKEPYESDEMEPSIGPYLFWFGHASNFPDLERISPSLKQPLYAMSNHPDLPQWTRDAFLSAISKPCIVIIPTGKSMAKSENRMVESIRCGKYVCAEYLPSYEPFEKFYGIGDIPTSIENALDSGDSIDRIKEAQEFIRDQYSPSAIARDWLRAIECL